MVWGVVPDTSIIVAGRRSVVVEDGVVEDTVVEVLEEVELVDEAVIPDVDGMG